MFHLREFIIQGLILSIVFPFYIIIYEFIFYNRINSFYDLCYGFFYIQISCLLSLWIISLIENCQPFYCIILPLGGPKFFSDNKHRYPLWIK
jgi:hypothetical protein